MLPDFPRCKKRLHDLFVRTAKASARRAEPMLAQIGTTIVHEGDGWSFDQEGGKKKHQKPSTLQAGVTITKQELLTMRIEDALAKASELGRQFAGQQMDMLITMLNQSTEEVGNVVKRKGDLIAPDAFLEMLSRMQIDFDQSGNPANLSSLSSPDNLKKLAKRMPQWMSDADFRRKYETIMSNKYEAWRDREADRTLAD